MTTVMASSCVSNNTNGWQFAGGMIAQPSAWVAPNTIYVGDTTPQPFQPWTQSPPFAPNPLDALEALGLVKDYTVPLHNFEPHCDILGNPVGCKHCSYANVHKLDPASHPFTVYEEA
jgi:hypothetical protein